MSEASHQFRGRALREVADSYHALKLTARSWRRDAAGASPRGQAEFQGAARATRRAARALLRLLRRRERAGETYDRWWWRLGHLRRTTWRGAAVASPREVTP